MMAIYILLKMNEYIFWGDNCVLFVFASSTKRDILFKKELPWAQHCLQDCMCAQRNPRRLLIVLAVLKTLGSLATHSVPRMHRLIWVIAGRTCSLLGNVVLQGPVVQSVVSLTSSLRVISLTVLADSIYNILNFVAEKMWVAFALTFFSKKFQHICVSLDVNFNESLTNDVVSFEQLGPAI